MADPVAMPADNPEYPLNRPHPSAERDDDMLAFGQYQLLPKLGVLMKEGIRLPLGERAIAVLIELVDVAGSVLSKEQLLARVWPQEIVEENNLQAQISSLRKALGDDRHLINTVFGRGYCFTATVKRLQASPPTLTKPAPSSGLPRPRSALIGRELALNELKNLLSHHKICTITGPAGIGKTRLLVEVAHALGSQFPDGIYFADLSGLSSSVDPSATLTTALAGLPRSTHQKPALLVVDNCEHLVTACAQALEHLLQSESHLSLLLTSQSPLGLEGERLYRLGPLALPLTEVSVSQAQHYSAIALLVQRAQAADHQFQLTADNLKSVAALCRLLDAVPLALEIAAGRIATLGLEAVLADLTKCAGMLESGRRGGTARHRTLGDALHWSYQLLTATEQQVFQELAIFAGEFDLSAAERLLSPVCEGRVIDIIGSLVDKSLLVFQSGSQPPRYRYLTIIKAYAWQLLAERRVLIGRRHAAFVGERITQAKVDWMSVATSQWLRRHGYLIDDLRSAIEGCFGAYQNRALGRYILANSTPFWIQFSLHEECRKLIAHALQDVGSEPVAPKEEMLMQAGLGSALAWARGPITENGQAWVRASDLAKQLADREIQMQAEYGLWLYHLRHGDYLNALHNGQNMLQLAQATGDQSALLTAKRLMGTAQHFCGQQSAALTEINAFLDCDIRDDRQSTYFRFGLDQRVAGWSFLVRVLWLTGDINQAWQAAQLGVDEALALDHACSLCAALIEGSCTLAALTGDIEQVVLLAQQIEQLASEHGLGLWQLYSSAFAFWARLQLNPSSVRPQEIHAMLNTLESNGFDPAYSLFLSDFALALAEKGQPQVAERLIQSRLALLPPEHSMWNAPELLRVQAIIHHIHQPDAVLLDNALHAAQLLAKEQNAEGWRLRIENTRRQYLSK